MYPLNLVTLKQCSSFFFSQNLTKLFNVINFLNGDVTWSKKTPWNLFFIFPKISLIAPLIFAFAFEFWVLRFIQLTPYFFPIFKIFSELEDRIIFLFSNILDFFAKMIVISTNEIPLIFLKFLFFNLSEPDLAGIKHIYFFFSFIRSNISLQF